MLEPTVFILAVIYDEASGDTGEFTIVPATDVEQVERLTYDNSQYCYSEPGIALDVMVFVQRVVFSPVPLRLSRLTEVIGRIADNADWYSEKWKEAAITASWFVHSDKPIVDEE